MHRFAAFILLLSSCTSSAIDAQTQTPQQPDGRESILSLMDITATPGIEYPIQSGFTLLNLGGAMDMKASVPLPFLPWLSASADLAYSYLPTLSDSSISIISVGLGPRATWEIAPRLSLYGYLSVGGYFGFFNKTAVDPTGLAYPNQQGGDPSAGGGGGFTFYLSPSLSMGVDADLLWYVGMNLGLRATIGTSFHLEGLTRKVYLEKIQFEDLYPSIYKKYAKKPPGSAVLANGERFPISDVAVSIFAKDFMDAPTTIKIPGRIRPGSSEPLDLGLLLSRRALDLKQSALANAEIRAEYSINGRRETSLSYCTVRIFNRNAISWDDDRKVASFLTPTDPEVLRFSNLIAGVVRDAGPAALNQNLRMALGVFTTLSSYGIKYVIVPNTPTYKDASDNPRIIDFAAFSGQTLSYKGGDCSDLSILVSSMLESVGIETAFITIPGHIFIAASLGVAPEAAKTTFSSANDLIYRDGKTWLPLEVTMLGSRFGEAWRQGAREWQENNDTGQAAFYPSHDCWAEYDMSGAPSDVASIDYPSRSEVRAAYDPEISALVDGEIDGKVRDLTARIAKIAMPAKERNDLGVLYARYGKTKEAEAQFLAALDLSEYVPAMLNLSNIRFIQGDFNAALAFLQRAERVAPGNGKVLVGLARVNYELANAAQVDKYVAYAEKSDPGSTDKFPYLRQQSGVNTGARAQDTLARRTDIQWATEQ
jgi:tetratricopeptide (TPR) repeat protein